MVRTVTFTDRADLAADESPRLHTLLLLAAFGAGVVAQGAYHPPGRVMMVTLVAVGAVGSMLGWRRAGRAGPVPWPVVALAGAIAAWVVARAAANGSIDASVPTVTTLGGFLAALVVVRCGSAAQRALCASAATGVGALVGISGWIGVVGRWPAWAFPTMGLWRASSTLTYSNAAAALLAALSLVAIAQLTERPSSTVRATAVYLTLVGLGATLSRGGAVAFLAGIATLTVLAGVRVLWWRMAPAAAGAIVALTALLPSFPADRAPRTGVAIAGMVVGLLVTLGLSRLTGWLRGGLFLAGVAFAAVAAMLMTPATTLRDIADGRLTLDSSGRSGALRAAIDLISAHPWFGVGPGQARFRWTNQAGKELVARYAHNEYLQVLVELGVVGLTLVLLFLVAMVPIVRRGRVLAAQPAIWSGACAALVTLAVHSGFDFLWHVAVIPLAAGMLVGLATPITTNHNEVLEPLPGSPNDQKSTPNP